MQLPILLTKQPMNAIVPYLFQRFAYEEKGLPYVGVACVIVPIPGDLYLSSKLPVVIGDKTVTNRAELIEAQDAYVEHLLQEDEAITATELVVQTTEDEDLLCV